MITHEIAGRIVRVSGTSIDIPVKGTFSYDRDDDPYAVQMIFTVDRRFRADDTAEEVCWRVSRDLLMDGLEKPSGQGDARVLSDKDVLILCLRNASGHADMKLSRPQVVHFIAATLEECALGDEALGVEGQLDDLLAEILGE